MYNVQDTIVAQATPAGVGAIGIIRLSGGESIPIVASIFQGKNLTKQPSHTLHFGRIKDNITIIDEVVVSLFRAPASYTAEDVVEISCHGSQYVLSQVLELCIRKGARMAKPGEYTLRAFLNGKLDLTQAEAVADLIASESGAAHKAAIHNLRGGFGHDLKNMREELIKFSALIELELDFSQEDVEFADRSQLYNLIRQLMVVVTDLVSSFRLGNVIKNGVKVAIIGKPNAGKSTLLNALLHEERAIVSEIPGTTRDTIEETLNINGILFRLIDTAGIRSHTTDVIEEQGMARSREAMQKADVVIYLFDASEKSYEGEIAAFSKEMRENETRYLLVGNKVDKLDNVGKFDVVGDDTQFISAKAGDNITQLKDRLYEMATDNAINTESTIITNTRHYEALQAILNALQDVKRGMDDNIPGDLLALDIRQCLYFLGEIAGSVTNEDTLDYIFSKFCIGK